MSCLSGTASPCYLLLQARPAHPHDQEQESQVCAGVEQNKIITRAGDVIAGGASGMEPCPPPQHWPPGVEYTHNILCIFNLHTVYVQKIYITYSIYKLGICIVYTINILCIYAVYMKYNLSIYNVVYTMNIPGI
jgi:hypothetical protein